jgi:hypothetical protein
MEKRKHPDSETQHSVREGHTKEYKSPSKLVTETADRLRSLYPRNHFRSLSPYNDSDESRESSPWPESLHDDRSETLFSKRCLVCNGLKHTGWSATKLRDETEELVFWTLQELEESSRNGCQLCGLIHEGVIKVVPAAKETKADQYSTIMHSTKSTYFTPKWSKSWESVSHEVEFFSFPGEFSLFV